MSFRTSSITVLAKKRGRYAIGLALTASVLPLHAAVAQIGGNMPAAASAPQVTPPPAGPVIPPVPTASISGVTGSVVVNLIRLLVEQGILTQDKANALIRQAEDEAASTLRAQASAPVTQMPNSGVATTGNVPPPAPVTPTPQVQVAPPAVAMAAAAPPASVRVPFIPEIVRRQIRDEVKEEVLQQARDENWAAPNAIPEWTKRFSLYGDFRLRYEWDLFDNRNSIFPNYTALNAGAPFDLNNSSNTPPPILNTNADRQRVRIRARLGFNAAISDDFTAGIRLATGNTTNPVTTNQTLGSTLNKYNFLLDRAFLTYQPNPGIKLWAGRFENPFMSTDLVWDEDIAFDGIAAQFVRNLYKNFSVFASGGAFPIEGSLFNFPDNSAVKEKSRDKWLYGAQIGADWRPRPAYDFKAAVGYYHFDQLEGKLSSACQALSASDPCDTDSSRPGFQQFGNTLFAIRNLVSSATSPPVFQYFGLATPFHELDATARFDYGGTKPIHVVVDVNYARNLAFNAEKITALGAVNNRALTGNSNAPGPWQGGGSAYQARLTFGYPSVREWGQWNTNIAYRYAESDSVVDAFNDSDFHLLGGTNSKGYMFGGTFGVGHNVNMQARWLSASEITGAPFTVDVVMVDLNAQF